MRRPTLRRLLLCVVGLVTTLETYRVIGRSTTEKSQTARSDETANVDVDREERHSSKSDIVDPSLQTTIPRTVDSSRSENRSLESSEIFISVKTTSRAHALRLTAQMETWMTLVEPRQVWFC